MNKFKSKSFIFIILSFFMFFCFKFIQVQANSSILNLPNVYISNKEYNQSNNETIIDYAIKLNGNDVLAINIDFSFKQENNSEYRIEYTNLLKNWLSAENTTIPNEIRIALASSNKLNDDGTFLRIIFKGKFSEELTITKLIINDKEIKVDEVENIQDDEEKEVTIVDPSELKPTGTEGTNKSDKQIITKEDLIEIDDELDLNEIINDSESKVIEVFFDNEDYIFKEKDMELLSILQKTIIFNKTNANGEIEYKWIIKGEFLKNVFDFKIGMIIDSINNKNIENKFEKLDNVRFVKSINEGEFPYGANFIIYVGDIFKDNESIYQFNIDSDNRISEEYETLKVVNGYNTMKIDDFGIYVLSNSNLIMSDNKILLFIYIASGALVLIMTLGKVYNHAKDKRNSA